MFKKLLIANRGEIACRILRTAQPLGIPCVSVYSQADKEALHVERADETVCLGPAPSQESYLNIPAVIAAAQSHGCDAIHPGYGFLSENAAFAHAVVGAGLTLIGPSPQAMEIMGDKIKAKACAQAAGVSVIPGTEGALSTAAEAQRVADEMGYPVMVKAAAGGGGKGMRIVRTADQLAEAFERAANEARAAFGDDRIFVERFIENPRHIEIQILADHHGHVIHLGERECSLQRRHQKVIEEAPSPFINEDLRQTMGAQAVLLAKAVDYTSAGTVEFILGEDHQFYFLEMNTRLQVEHPITEFITGLDLVEEMLRSAAGEPLRHTQEDITFKGHAIEARVYAEDSERGFLPSSGRLVDYRPPPTDASLRLDTGVVEGNTITTHYDPLMAKLVAYGPNREAARMKLATNVDAFYIRGVETNLAFLSHLLNSQAFIDAQINTTTLDAQYKEGFTPQPPEKPWAAVATMAVVTALENPGTSIPYTILLGQTPYPTTLKLEGGCYEVSGEEWTEMVETSWRPGEPVFQGIFNGHLINFQIEKTPAGTTLTWEGQRAQAQALPSSAAVLYRQLPQKEQKEASDQVLSPMPGLVVDIRVKAGDTVKAGQALAVVEAMKMENVIRAPLDGIIKEVLVELKENVTVDQTLFTLGV